jgi:hypothetical protein
VRAAITKNKSPFPLSFALVIALSACSRRYDKARPAESATSPSTDEPLLAPATKIEVGHADPRGDDNYNLALGGRRADSVKSVIVNEGVPSSRVLTSSRGEMDALERMKRRGLRIAALISSRRNSSSFYDVWISLSTWTKLEA